MFGKGVVPSGITPGFYFCVATPGWGSRLIRWGTRSAFNHAGMITSVEGDTVEAQPGGVRKGHLSAYNGYKAVISSGLSMDLDQQTKVVAAAAAMIGVPYNDLGIVDDGLESLGIVWKWLANAANTDEELICSQAVALMGKAGGYDWMCGKADASEVTPGDLARQSWMRPWEIKA